jgi:4-amino-4-deoxy-L-arabinose transferase-like glycosyltransferase
MLADTLDTDSEIQRSPAIPRARRALLGDVLAILAIVGVFSWSCFRDLSLPGPYEDEVWGATHAMRFAMGRSKIDDGEFAQFRLFDHTFPWMRFAYTGPVKTYVLAGPFAVFGVRIEVMRATTGVLGLLGVLAASLLARRHFGRAAGLFTGLLLATDLNYVLAVRDDWGPVAFGLFALLVGLYSLFAWASDPPRQRSLFFGALLLGLGVSHKPDFLGVVVAVGFATLMWYWRRLRPATAALAIVGFLAGAWPILLYNALSGWETLRVGTDIAASRSQHAFPQTPEQMLELLRALPGGTIDRALELSRMLRGTAVGGDFILHERLEQFSPFGASIMPLALQIAPVVLLFGVVRRRYSGWLRPLGFLCTSFIMQLLLMAAMPLARGPHHLMLAYPYPHMLIGVALAVLWAGSGSWLGPLMRAAAMAGLVVLVGVNLSLANAFHERVMTTGGHGYWSDATYELYDILRTDYAGRPVELSDWGLVNALGFLGQDTLELRTPHWWLADSQTPDSRIRALLMEPNHVFVRRGEAFADKAITRRLQAVATDIPGLLVDERKVYERDGTHAFSVLTFSLNHAP